MKLVLCFEDSKFLRRPYEVLLSREGFHSKFTRSAKYAKIFFRMGLEDGSLLVLGIGYVGIRFYFILGSCI
jgi:hypothetical protein